MFTGVDLLTIVDRSLNQRRVRQAQKPKADLLRRFLPGLKTA
jgi:hypothetical protein